MSIRKRFPSARNTSPSKILIINQTIMKADAIGRIASARNLDVDEVELFDKTKFPVSDLSLKKRKVDAEELII